MQTQQPDSPRKTPISLRRTRYSKECPNGCGRLCDRQSKQCGICLSENYAKTRKIVEAELALIDQRVLRANEPRDDQADTIERAGFCLDGDYCPRWHCRACDRYWLGRADEHHCAGERP